jgi:uncharacterized protein (DUF952 family)
VQIFHIAEADRWAAARLAGSYAQSTLDRTLEEEGFLHAAREDQWQGVLDRHYADITKPLVLLVIDTDKLTSPWREDLVGDTTYPHIYGPLNPSAVVETIPLKEDEKPRETFFSVFLGDVTLRMFLAIGAMVLALLGGLLGQAWSDTGALIGFLAGLALGVVGAVVIYRARDRLRS